MWNFISFCVVLSVVESWRLHCCCSSNASSSSVVAGQSLMMVMMMIVSCFLLHCDILLFFLNWVYFFLVLDYFCAGKIEFWFISTIRGFWVWPLLTKRSNFWFFVWVGIFTLFWFVCFWIVTCKSWQKLSWNCFDHSDDHDDDNDEVFYGLCMWTGFL